MSKKNKLFVIILIICLIIISIMVFLLNKEQKRKDYADNIREFQEFREKYESETILARNATVIFKYDGEYDRDYLYKDMKKFSDYMYYLKEQVTTENYEKFYQRNSDDIKNFLGLESQDEFEKFIEELQDVDVSEDTFRYAAYVVNSTAEENGYFTFKIDFYYGENENKVTFKVYFSNYKDNNIDVKYEFSD